MDLTSKRTCVTAGAGFFRSFLVERLKARGVRDVFVPTIEKYDLVQPDAVRRMLDGSRPDVIFHLAAQVGGIGASRAHPAEFFYNNLMTGTCLSNLLSPSPERWRLQWS